MLVLFASCAVVAQTAHAEGLSTIGVGELKPGMSGYGYTVFQGTKPEKFDLTLIDIIDSPFPGKKFLLVKIDHKDVTFGRGFSGSPVYFKGRLAGAISFGETLRAVDIMMATVIDDMLAELERAKSISARMDGMERVEETEEYKNAVASLKPGGMIAVPFLRGDLWDGSTGTLSAINDNMIMAFGHGSNAWGDGIMLPLHAARVHSVIQKLDMPYKLSTTDAEIGAVVWDGRSAIIGRIGLKAPMSPFKVTFVPLNKSEAKTFNLEIARHTKLIPVLASKVITSVVNTYGLRKVDEAAYEVAYSIKLSGRGAPFELSLRYNHTQLSNIETRSGYALELLFRDMRDPLIVESIDLAITEIPEGETAQIVNAYFGAGSVSAGEEATLYVVLKLKTGEKTVSIKVPIPADTPSGTFNVLVSPGDKIRPIEDVPMDADDMIEWLSGMLRSDDLVVLYQAAGRQDAYYARANVARAVKRLGWAMSGNYEASIRIRGEH